MNELFVRQIGIVSGNSKSHFWRKQFFVETPRQDLINVRLARFWVSGSLLNFFDGFLLRSISRAILSFLMKFRIWQNSQRHSTVLDEWISIVVSSFWLRMFDDKTEETFLTKISPTTLKAVHCTWTSKNCPHAIF